MRVGLDLAALRQTTWRQYAVRFLFGGFVTAAAGVIADKYGPAMGGLFLAFPAIFPASATLLEKRQQEKKRRARFTVGKRGRDAVRHDAAGAAQGAIGLLAFAVVVWAFIAHHRPWALIATATVVWFLVACGIWRFRKLPRRALRKLYRTP
jgi:hypothetical protein